MSFIKKSSMAFKLSCCTLGILAIPQSFAQTISGKVVNTYGKPSANSQVTLSHSTKKAYTDDQGYFEISGLDAGEYELHIVAKNYSHFNQHVSVGANDLSGLLYTLTPSVMENIDVFATPLHSSSIESALPINVLTSDELRLKQASTLGETLKGELGVHSSYFGPVSSSPIIRGLDGPRVMVTQNGLDVGDASRVGPDHVVSSEASTATQIEVLRGPATLFYGSGAIGGVVNVVDSRIPTSVDNQVDYFVKHNDVADENEASFNVNTGIALNNDAALAFHVDAFYRESNDYKIPLMALKDDDHEDEHEEEHEDEHEEHEELTDSLDNSSSRAKGYNAGVSYILDNGYIGFSYGFLDRKYGLPGHEHHEEEHEEDHDEDHDELDHEEHEEEAVYSLLEQDRYQMLSDFTFDNNLFHRFATKISYTDYIHQEIEEGAVGTTFKNKMLETRFDLYHKPLNDWKGALTFHYKKSDFEASGEEAFTPPSTTTMTALAWLEEKHFDQFLVQAGIRFEHVSLKAELSDENSYLNEDIKEQSFSPLSSSLGVVWNFTQGYNIGLSLGYSERAPSASEVFSNGPHIGTSTFELGAQYQIDELTGAVVLADSKVDIETSFNADLSFRKFEGDLGFIVSAFYNRIDDYYYQRNTGFTSEIFEDEEEHNEEGHEHDEENFLPIYAFDQSDVDLYGFESELIYQVSPSFKAKIFGDYIRAKLTDGGNLPRIPPLRIGSEFTYTGEKFSATLTAQRYFDQNKVAESETSTEGYTMVDANVNYYLDNIGNDFVLFLKVDNITDEDARVHSSFLKDKAPLPARGISVGVRGSF